MMEANERIASVNLMAELHQSMVEVASGVCGNIQEAREDVIANRREAARVAGDVGMRIGAASTHPFSRWQEQQISSGERYDKLVVELQDVARANVIFGMHVHVGIEDPEEAIAFLHIAVKDPDEKKVGRAFANAMTELALSTIPGFFGVGGGPAAGRPFGVYEPARIPASAVPQEIVFIDGDTKEIDSVIPDGDVTILPAKGPAASIPDGSTTRIPIGRIIGARSGDKGGNANLGVFARSDEAWAWLDDFLTTERLRSLLPEVAQFNVDRIRLPALRSLNFVIHGILEEGVAAATRQDGQAKSLGEWLRARVVDIPESLLS
jgi:hypothetical protein